MVNSTFKQKSIEMKDDLLTMTLRNDLRHEIQEIRKELMLSVTDRISMYIELNTSTNWFISFASPNLVYPEYRETELPKMTNIDYLKYQCFLDDLVLNINGLYFSGEHSVHDKRLEKIKGEFLKEIDITVAHFDVNLKFFKI